jgi:hypothetical protein
VAEKFGSVTEMMEFFKKTGARGGKATAKKMTSEQRRARAKKAAAASAKVRTAKAKKRRKQTQAASAQKSRA